jgi:hypothetical protein
LARADRVGVVDEPVDHGGDDGVAGDLAKQPKGLLLVS